MADILVYSSWRENLVEIERLIKSKDLRAKVTTDKKTCIDWLSVRPFHLVFIDSSIGSRELKEVTSKIWQANKDCRVIAFDINGAFSLDALLIGAEVASSDNIWEVLSQALDDIKAERHEKTSTQHILVVEDLDSPRDIICMFLEGLGLHKISSASSAKEALELIRKNPNTYTTVLTDVRMPEMSGDELIRVIRTTNGLERIPVVALTAYGTADCLLECLKAGATGFLVKPPKKPDLMRELERANRLRRSGAPVRLVPADKVELLYAMLEEKGIGQV